MLSNCAKQWLVKFNPLKTKAVLFALKNIEALPQLIFDNTIINVDYLKHVGITFNSNCQWHTHIKNITIIATKRESSNLLSPEMH